MSPSDGVAARLRAIQHRYGKTVALDDVTLAIPAGGLAGLIGPDGVTVLSEQQDLTLVQAFRDQFEVLTSPLGRVDFLSTSGQPRFCVDDVNVALVLPSVVNVTSFTGGPGGFTITWDSGGAPVTVSRSTDLINWTDISLGDADGTHTDASAPAGKAFYRVELP